MLQKHPLVATATATAVAAARHLPPPQPWSLHGFIVVVFVIIVSSSALPSPPSFDCYVLVSSPLFCREFALLLHPFHHHLPSCPPFVCLLLFQAADKAIVAGNGVVIVFSAFRSRWLLSLSAPAHSRRFPCQSM